MAKPDMWSALVEENTCSMQAGAMAYFGARLGQLQRIFGRKLSLRELQRIYAMLAPRKRQAREVGLPRAAASGGRIPTARYIRELNAEKGAALAVMLDDYMHSYEQTRSMPAALIGSWRVYEAMRRATEQVAVHESDSTDLNFEVLILGVELMHSHRLSVVRCPNCRTRHLMLDLVVRRYCCGCKKPLHAGSCEIDPLLAMRRPAAGLAA